MAERRAKNKPFAAQTVLDQEEPLMPDPLTDPTDIRRYSNALRIMSERRIEGITQRFISGEIDLAGWQDEMKAELRRGNHEQFVVGKAATAARSTAESICSWGRN